MDSGDEIVTPLPITQGTVQQIPNGCTGSSSNSAASIKLSRSLTNRLFVFWSTTSLVAQINNTCHICLHYCCGLVKLFLDTWKKKPKRPAACARCFGGVQREFWRATVLIMHRSQPCHSQSQQQLLLNQQCNARRMSLRVKKTKNTALLFSFS